MPTVRLERPADYPEVHELLRASFATADFSDGTEAEYLDNLRRRGTFIPELAFVAEADGVIVGQIVLSGMAVLPEDGTALATRALALSPICAHPAHMRRGISRMLIDHALAEAVRMGYTSVFLCGSPALYTRFGSVPSYWYGIYHVGDHAAEWCMARELVQGALLGITGEIDIL